MGWRRNSLIEFDNKLAKEGKGSKRDHELSDNNNEIIEQLKKSKMKEVSEG